VLLIPLSLSGHHHRADDAAPKQHCSLCMVSSGCPALRTAAAPLLIPPAATGLVSASAPAAPACGTYQPFKAGRAPPTALAPLAA